MMMERRVLLLLLLNIAVAVSNDALAKAELDPNYFVTFGSDTFYLGIPHDAMTAANARTLCEENGMTLVNLETEEKWLPLREYLSNNGIMMTMGFWTSGRYFRDLEPDQGWQWTGNGSVPFDYTAWSPGFPSYFESSIGDNVCVLFSAYYSWMDTDCRKYDAYTLCEY